MAKHGKSEVEEAKAELKKLFARKDVFRTRAGKPVMFAIVRHVAPSGMSRIIDPIIFTTDGPLYIWHRVGILLGLSYDDKHNGLRVGGVGMNMIFWMANNLAGAMDLPDGSLGYESL